MKKIINAACLFAGAYALLLAGCKKDDNGTSTTTSTPVDSGKVALHIHTYLGTEEVDGYNITYTLDDGRKISLSTAQFYVSDIQLIKNDDTTYPVAGKMLLKTLETESYNIGSVPVGAYKAVKFKVGLDAITNALPAAGNDLLNRPEMWFGSSVQPDGYVFLNAQGKVDTTADASGTIAQMQPFVYKIGTAAHYVQIIMPDHNPAYSITKGNTEFVHMYFDYNRLFTGVTLSNPSNLIINSKADNNAPISATISNNIANSFSYEE
jgi:hypothetical protein